MITGEYSFYDNLQFKDKDWNYCTIQECRLYTEDAAGTLRPEGKTLFCNQMEGPKDIPEGTYDIGDGFFDPTKRIICDYDGEFKRDLQPDEEQWITDKCRYNPRIFRDDTHLSGGEDTVI